MLRYLIFLIIGIIIFIALNDIDSFSIGIPFNYDDKVVINPGIFLEMTGINGNIQQRTGVIRGVQINVNSDNRYIVYYTTPGARHTSFRNIGERELTIYDWRLYIPLRYRVCRTRE